jgi:membrane associated rhomboid family serine protease
MIGKHKITFNAPFTLWFSFICISIFFIEMSGVLAVEQYFVLQPEFEMANWKNWLTLFTYSVAHADLAHLLGNLSFILLLGPMLEQKYGVKNLSVMVLITIIVTALADLFFFKQAVLGSSGIVFMLVMLTSFANMKKNTIPLTFLLVAFLFLGKEVLESYKEDNVAQFAHIIGGVCGSIFGFRLGK